MKTFRTVRSQRIVRTLVVAFLASVPLVAI